MPFLDDSGVRTEEKRGPIWDAFATLADQVERMIALNIGWALQQAPGAVALMLTDWPIWVRLLLAGYSALALAPATGVLYALVARACDGEMLRWELVGEALRAVAKPSLFNLMPLFAAAGALLFVAVWAASARWMLLDALAQLGLLLLAATSLYWGALFAERPQRSAFVLLRRSLSLIGQYPLHTSLLAAVSAFALLLGIVSIGGMVLIVPVVLALLQTHMLRHLRSKRDA
ncbi:MAG: hypothetical protein K6U78_05680 [Anaerolineae bacterium]|nr:hypothetical protein [Anaerolineae bacterium]